jgi:hypothetical protein
MIRLGYIFADANSVRYIPRNSTYKPITGQTITGIVSRDGYTLRLLQLFQLPLHVRYVDGTEKFCSDINYELYACPSVVLNRVGNFRQKNNSAEDGIDGTNGYFRRNSGHSAEQKLSEFRSEPFSGRANNSEFRSVEQN